MWEISCTSPPQGLSTRRFHCIWKPIVPLICRGRHTSRHSSFPNLTYYSSSGVFGAPDDPYAHLDPACKATESPIGMYGNAASALGKQLCPLCGKVDDARIRSGAYCSFALADADGNLLPYRERASCSTTLLPDAFDENRVAYLAVSYGGEQLAMLSVR